MRRGRTYHGGTPTPSSGTRGHKRGEAGRPVLAVPRTRWDSILEAASLAGVFALAVMPAYYWSDLPAVVPTHFGITGVPDAWGSKYAVLLVPVVGAVLYAGITAVSCYPHLFNYPWPITEENAYNQYRLARTLMTALKAEITWLFVFLERGLILTALGRSSGLAPWLLPATVVAVAGTLAVWYRRAARAK